MSVDLKPRADVEPTKEPAKRWWNWWEMPCDCVFNGADAAKGDICPGSGVYPSKDLAETAALEGMREASAPVYLGAFPEGERP